jgi:hypothetical protein
VTNWSTVEIDLSTCPQKKRQFSPGPGAKIPTR